ncbi:MAG TPA: type II toxin-antitoxin system CcdA family antitoxin [Methanocorpusculum sp.]|nr:type II toxin-antitoxin system CcdA family antitoxin [Methanocorpusculum sp.]HJJ39981.1 type II toxin-antitoxin system CcdA family antitoxin [Methanocorpusculum sp.]HJJ49464.1 type II toxin-antitoxin system CcdA family antitoxin [Methanocorpusculum sp.]HJJ57016.1 type II toxin-antitoxin system CcdA family antitoxin [Methanocorpusculum sp.]
MTVNKTPLELPVNQQMINVGITMPSSLRQQARESGINISDLARKAVEQAITEKKGDATCL